MINSWYVVSIMLWPYEFSQKICIWKIMIVYNAILLRKCLPLSIINGFILLFIEIKPYIYTYTSEVIFERFICSNFKIVTSTEILHCISYLIALHPNDIYVSSHLKWWCSLKRPHNKKWKLQLNELVFTTRRVYCIQLKI